MMPYPRLPGYRHVVEVTLGAVDEDILRVAPILLGLVVLALVPKRTLSNPSYVGEMPKASSADG